MKIIRFFQLCIGKRKEKKCDCNRVLILDIAYVKPYGMRFSKLVTFLFYLKNWAGDALLTFLSLDSALFGKSWIWLICDTLSGLYLSSFLIHNVFHKCGKPSDSCEMENQIKEIGTSAAITGRQKGLECQILYQPFYC